MSFSNVNSDRMFVIAEIGTGHLGERSKAKELIRAAAEAGADCAKFQVVFAEEGCMTGSCKWSRMKTFTAFARTRPKLQEWCFWRHLLACVLRACSRLLVHLGSRLPHPS